MSNSGASAGYQRMVRNVVLGTGVTQASRMSQPNGQPSSLVSLVELGASKPRVVLADWSYKPVSVKTLSLVPLMQSVRSLQVEMLTMLLSSRMRNEVPSQVWGCFGSRRARTSMKPLNRFSFGISRPNLGLAVGRKQSQKTWRSMKPTGFQHGNSSPVCCWNGQICVRLKATAMARTNRETSATNSSCSREAVSPQVRLPQHHSDVGLGVSGLAMVRTRNSRWHSIADQLIKQSSCQRNRMFDTEGFHSINDTRQGKHRDRSHNRQRRNMHHLSQNASVVGIRFRKDRSSKNLSKNMQIKLVEKSTSPLLRIWMDGLQEVLKEQMPDCSLLQGSLGHLAKVIECFPGILKDTAVEVRSLKAGDVKVPFSELVREFLKARASAMEISQSRNGFGGLFSDFCRLIEQLQQTKPIISASATEEGLASQIIQEFALQGETPKKSGDKLNIYDELYSSYQQYMDVEAESIATLVKKVEQDKHIKPSQPRAPPTTLLQRLNAQTCFSEEWRLLVNPVSLVSPPEQPTAQSKQQDSILQSIYELKRQTESMMRILQDKLISL